MWPSFNGDDSASIDDHLFRELLNEGVLVGDLNNSTYIFADERRGFLEEYPIPGEAVLTSITQPQTATSIKPEESNCETLDIVGMGSKSSLPPMQDGSTYTSGVALPHDWAEHIPDSELLDLDGTANQTAKDDWIERLFFPDRYEGTNVATNTNGSADRLEPEQAFEQLVEIQDHKPQEQERLGEEIAVDGAIEEKINLDLTLDAEDEALLQEQGYNTNIEDYDFEIAALREGEQQQSLGGGASQKEAAKEEFAERDSSENNLKADGDDKNYLYESDEYEHLSDEESSEQPVLPPKVQPNPSIQDHQPLSHQVTTGSIFFGESRDYISPYSTAPQQQPVVPTGGSAWTPIELSDSLLRDLAPFMPSGLSNHREHTSGSAPQAPQQAGQTTPMFSDHFRPQSSFHQQIASPSMNVGPATIPRSTQQTTQSSRRRASRQPAPAQAQSTRTPPQAQRPATSTAPQPLRWRSRTHGPYKKNGELHKVVERVFLRPYMNIYHPGYQDSRMGNPDGQGMIIAGFPAAEKARFDQYAQQCVAQEQAERAASLGLPVPSYAVGAGTSLGVGDGGVFLGGNMAAGAVMGGHLNGHTQQGPGGNGRQLLPRPRPHPYPQSNHPSSVAGNAGANYQPQEYGSAQNTHRPTSQRPPQSTSSQSFGYNSQSKVHHTHQSTSQTTETGSGINNLHSEHSAADPNAWMNFRRSHIQPQNPPQMTNSMTGTGPNSSRSQMGGSSVQGSKRGRGDDDDDEEDREATRARKRSRRG
jgi:hypothetical protein